MLLAFGWVVMMGCRMVAEKVVMMDVLMAYMLEMEEDLVMVDYWGSMWAASLAAWMVDEWVDDSASWTVG